MKPRENLLTPAMDSNHGKLLLSLLKPDDFQFIIPPVFSPFYQIINQMFIVVPKKMLVVFSVKKKQPCSQSRLQPPAHLSAHQDKPPVFPRLRQTLYGGRSTSRVQTGMVSAKGPTRSSRFRRVCSDPVQTQFSRALQAKCVWYHGFWGPGERTTGVERPSTLRAGMWIWLLPLVGNYAGQERQTKCIENVNAIVILYHESMVFK